MPDTDDPQFNLLYMFHPTAYVLSLDETDAWFEKVFRLPSVRLNTAPQDPNNRMDYSTFTMIRDVDQTGLAAVIISAKKIFPRAHAHVGSRHRNVGVPTEICR